MPVRLRSALPVAAVALALALAGCTPSPSPSASRTASETSSPSSTAQDPTTTALPSPTASVTGSPVGKTCSQLISNDAMYAYNPNFVPLTSYTPAAGSSGAQATTYKGVACRWQNETSNGVIDLSVANLDPATIESLKNQAVAKSTLVPSYQGADEGYFSEGNGAGTAIVFVKSYWIVITSQQFAEPGDAEQLVDGVIAALS
jgi:hypothetical protein